MLLGFLFSLAVTLASSSVTEEIPAPPAHSVVYDYGLARADVDASAEHELLALVNRARVRAELPPLQLDSKLTLAAREHAAVMAAHQLLTHQYSGEPGLAYRVANFALHLDEAAENIATADSADRAHEGLMHSPPHRENLMHPAYNIIGLGVVRRGSILYVVEDFGHSLPVYTARQAADIVARTVRGARGKARLPDLERREGNSFEADACSGTRASLLRTSSGSFSARSRYIFRYTAMTPESLPGITGRAISDRGIRAFAVGACFARSERYPSGVYSMTLVFY